MQHTATRSPLRTFISLLLNTLQHTATHGNTRQHTATHCNTFVSKYLHISLTQTVYTEMRHTHQDREATHARLSTMKSINDCIILNKYYAIFYIFHILDRDAHLCTCVAFLYWCMCKYAAESLWRHLFCMEMCIFFGSVFRAFHILGVTSSAWKNNARDFMCLHKNVFSCAYVRNMCAVHHL